MNPKKIKIGCASAFWGDTSSAARQLVEKGDIDYLVSDFLAEMTMSILAGSKKNNPKMGYATDFIEQLSPLLEMIKSKNIKVISNAGGVNLNSCKEALEEITHSLGVALNIAIIAGDDLMSKKNELMGLNIKEMETDKELPDNLLSANAYLGAIPINEALKNLSYLKNISKTKEFNSIQKQINNKRKEQESKLKQNKIDSYTNLLDAFLNNELDKTQVPSSIKNKLNEKPQVKSSSEALNYACVKLEALAGIDSLKKDFKLRQSIQMEMLTNKFNKVSNNLNSVDDLLIHFVNNISAKPTAAEKTLWKRVSKTIDILV